MEAILAIVIIAIMSLGTTLLVLKHNQQKQRDMVVRVADQYANDAIEKITSLLRNADSVSSQRDRGTYDKIELFTYSEIHNELLKQTLRCDQFKGITIGQERINHEGNLEVMISSIPNSILSISKFQLRKEPEEYKGSEKFGECFRSLYIIIEGHVGKYNYFLPYEASVFLKNYYLRK